MEEKTTKLYPKSYLVLQINQINQVFSSAKKKKGIPLINWVI